MNKQFCTLLANDANNLQWGDVHEDARGSARCRKQEKMYKKTQHPTTGRAEHIPWGFCHEFHRGRDHNRDRCRYWHKCYNKGCFKEHSFDKCPFPPKEPYIEVSNLPKPPKTNKPFLGSRPRASKPYQKQGFGRGAGGAQYYH